MSQPDLHRIVTAPEDEIAGIFGDLVAAFRTTDDPVLTTRPATTSASVPVDPDDDDEDEGGEEPLTGPQAQGDLYLAPAAMLDGVLPATGRAIPVPLTGVVVLDGGPGGNTHTVTGQGTWAAATRTDSNALGVLTVLPGQVARVVHSEEHTDLVVGAGVYVVARQRRWAPAVPTPQPQLDEDDAGGAWWRSRPRQRTVRVPRYRPGGRINERRSQAMLQWLERYE